jgi:hypothetical protein
MPHPENLVPTQSGNKLAVKSGMYSESLVNLKADELRPRVIDSAPWVAAPEFAGTLDLYVRALATALLGLEYIAQVAAEKGYGKVAPRTIETVNAMTNTAARLGTLLGLDPKAKAVIQSLAVSTESSLASLDRLSETGRQIRQRRARAIEEKDKDNAADETSQT